MFGPAVWTTVCHYPIKRNIRIPSDPAILFLRMHRMHRRHSLVSVLQETYKNVYQRCCLQERKVTMKHNNKKLGRGRSSLHQGEAAGGRRTDGQRSPRERAASTGRERRFAAEH